MKKLLAVLLFALFSAGFAWSGESAYYAKALPIYKITSHEKGYKVVYQTAHGDLQVVYIPLEWFYQGNEYKTDDGFVKAELVRGKGEQYPFLQIFWKEGKFHHVRLFVVDSYSDRTWGVVNPAENLGAKFDPAKPLDFKF